MNKTLSVLIIGIIVIAGTIGYIFLEDSKNGTAHTAGDGHTEIQHTEALPHDDTERDPHQD